MFFFSIVLLLQSIWTAPVTQIKSRRVCLVHILWCVLCNCNTHSLLQVFFELLKLIKADRERHQNPPQSSPPLAANSSKRSSMMAPPTDGGSGVKGVPEGQDNRRKPAKPKKKKRRKGGKGLGRRHGRRGGSVRRRLRRTMRRACLRIASCRIMWHHRLTSSLDRCRTHTEAGKQSATWPHSFRTTYQRQTV